MVDILCKPRRSIRMSPRQPHLCSVKTLVTQTFRAGPGAKDLLIYVGICDKVLLERVM